MDDQLQQKIDRLIFLLEEQEAANYHQAALQSRIVHRELILNTILASAVGYFIMRILDHHFR